MVKFLVLFFAILFSIILISSKLTSILNFIIYKIDEDKKIATINFILIVLSSLFMALYITIY